MTKQEEKLSALLYNIEKMEKRLRALYSSDLIPTRVKAERGVEMRATIDDAKQAADMLAMDIFEEAEHGQAHAA